MLLAVFALGLAMILFTLYGYFWIEKWSVRVVGFLSLLQAAIFAISFVVSGNWLFVVIAVIFYGLSALLLIMTEEETCEDSLING